MLTNSETDKKKLVKNSKRQRKKIKLFWIFDLNFVHKLNILKQNFISIHIKNFKKNLISSKSFLAI